MCKEVKHWLFFLLGFFSLGNSEAKYNKNFFNSHLFTIKIETPKFLIKFLFVKIFFNYAFENASSWLASFPLFLPWQQNNQSFMVSIFPFFYFILALHSFHHFYSLSFASFPPPSSTPPTSLLPCFSLPSSGALHVADFWYNQDRWWIFHYETQPFS